MSMLSHRFEAPSRGRQDARSATLSTARRAMIRRVFLRVGAVLLMGAVLAGLIALKTAIFFWRFQY